nr:hypothetical protein CFP56_23985 [Quercus suber]
MKSRSSSLEHNGERYAVPSINNDRSHMVPRVDSRHAWAIRQLSVSLTEQLCRCKGAVIQRNVRMAPDRRRTQALPQKWMRWKGEEGSFRPAQTTLRIRAAHSQSARARRSPPTSRKPVLESTSADLSSTRHQTLAEAHYRQ